MLLTSRVLSFKRGGTRAVLKAEGKQLVCRERLMTCKSSANIQLKTDQNNFLGIGSRGQVIDLRTDIILFSKLASTISKLEKVLVGGERILISANTDGMSGYYLRADVS